MLKPATSADLDYFYELYMHPEINPYLLYEPMAKTDFEHIYADLLQKAVLYIFSSKGEAVGMCKLVPQQHRNSHTIYLGGVAIDPAHSGKGYGLEMLTEIIVYAKEQQCRRIELSTATTNDRAIRLYERAGFEKEGVLRRYTFLKKENRFLDEILMSWIDKDYFAFL